MDEPEEETKAGNLLGGFIQVRDDGGPEQNSGSGGGEQWADSGYM